MSRKMFLLLVALSFVFTVGTAYAGDIKFAEKKDDIINELSKPATKKASSKGFSTIKSVSGTKDIKLKPEGGGDTPAPEPEQPRVAAMILFKYNSTEILPRSVSILEEFGKALNDEKLKKSNFCVEGHTDGDGSPEYNMQLSNKRAQAIVDYLVKNCDISRERLSSRGWGKTRPIDTNETEEGKQKNRRVEFSKVN